MLYIDRLEIAPSNRRTADRRDLLGAGTALFRIAQDISEALDMDSAIGLHALPNPEAFYRKIGMEEFRRDPEHENLRYYELWGELGI